MKNLFCLAIALTCTCYGQTIYTYTGHNFTVASGTVPATGHITVALTVSTALAPNGSYSPLSLSSWTMSDGTTTLSSTDGQSSIVATQITTDGSGKITSWNITGTRPGLKMQTCLALFQCNGDLTQYGTGSGSGQASGSWVVTQAPPPTPAPAAPTGVTATAGSTQVTLTWGASAGATGYNVKRGAASGGPYTTISTALNALTYTDVGLTNGTTYYYVVSALGSGGESSNSTEVNAKPSAPVAPTLTITPATVPGGTVGTAYSQILVVTGGAAPYSCSVVTGTPPAGLTVITGSSTGQCLITGTPTVAASYSFTVQVSDHNGNLVSQAYTIAVSAPVPSVCSGCVLNAASFAKDATGKGTAVAPGSLVAIFTSPLAVQPATFTGVPFPESLGNVSVTFNTFFAPMVSVTPGGSLPYVSAQVPFEALPSGTSSAMVPVVLFVNGVPSVAVQTPIVQSAPGIFTIPPTGQGNGILVFLDPSDNRAKIAAPASAASTIGYPTAPIPRGTNAFFYATGLGAMTPAVVDGSGTCTASNGLCTANATPQVFVGGISAPVQFAGQAPGFPGVSQINIMIPMGAPTGTTVPLIMKSADGSVTSNTAIIAVQ